MYERVSKIFRTGRLERELQMVQLFATRFSCIAILWVSLVSFTVITLCVASQRVFVVVVVVVVVVISLSTQSGNFWIHPCTSRIQERRNIAVLSCSSKFKFCLKLAIYCPGKWYHSLTRFTAYLRLSGWQNVQLHNVSMSFWFCLIIKPNIYKLGVF
jgi:hypothetical protein